MVAQSPPFAEQNAQHSATLFRLATFSPWQERSGIVGPTDFALTAQSTPNMSVQVGAGRAWLKGTQVASVSGGTWSPQGAYFGYNDAPVTLTVAAADPTNPRIDAVVAYVTDSFYSGATNTFVLAIVTGTPAASPAVPAVPSNGLLLGTLAVAANATSISSGNIAATPTASLLLGTRGGVGLALSTDTSNGTYDGQYRDHPTYGLQRWNAAAGAWRLSTDRVIGETYQAPSGVNGTILNSFETAWLTLNPAYSSGGPVVVRFSFSLVNGGSGADRVCNVRIVADATTISSFQVTVRYASNSNPPYVYEGVAYAASLPAGSHLFSLHLDSNNVASAVFCQSAVLQVVEKPA